MSGVFDADGNERKFRWRDAARAAPPKLGCDKRTGSAASVGHIKFRSTEPPADTPPNAVFVDDPSVISDKVLDFCCITIFEACCGQLTFRQNFNLEASDQDPNLGFDGGVLEISVDQGQRY